MKLGPSFHPMAAIVAGNVGSRPAPISDLTNANAASWAARGRLAGVSPLGFQACGSALPGKTVGSKSRMPERLLATTNNLAGGHDRPTIWRGLPRHPAWRI